MQEKNISIIHYIIVALFCFLFRFIPGFAGITPLGMGILGTFIGAIYGWITIGMFWPSIIALTGIGWSVGVSQMLSASFSNVAVIGLVVLTPLIAVCNETGAFTWVIDKVLTSKAMQGKGWLSFWLLLIIAYSLGFTNPIITCLIFCSFVSTICKQVGIVKNEKLPIFWYLGIAFASMLGQILFPFMGTGLLLLMAYNSMFPDFPLDFVAYMLYILPMGIIMVTLYTLVCKFIFRVDASKLADFKSNSTTTKPISREQFISLLFFLAFIVLVLLASLPLGVISAFLNNFGLVGIAFILMAIMSLIKKSDGTQLTNVEANMRNTSWGQIFMVGFIMVISTYMNTSDTGIPLAMSALLTPFTSLPPLAFVVVALAFAAVMTNVANNMIVIVLVMPFMFSFSSSIGLSPTGMISLLFILSQFALATPAASPVTAVAMNSEMADATAMTKAALKIVPLMFAISICIGWPLAQIMF